LHADGAVGAAGQQMTNVSYGDLRYRCGEQACDDCARQSKLKYAVNICLLHDMTKCDYSASLLYMTFQTLQNSNPKKTFVCGKKLLGAEKLSFGQSLE
jgi:hypothetical protein